MEYHGLDDAERDALIEEFRIQILENGDTYHAQGARASLEVFSDGKHFRIFEDTWEWDLSDYTVQFLWCCFAIRWGISRFDVANDESEAT